MIKDIRGNGTFLGFDLVEAKQTDSMQKWLLKRGIVTAKVGPSTLGIRPALILGPSQAAMLRDEIRNFHPAHVQFDKDDE